MPMVVRLNHTERLRQDQLWRYAADFKANTRKAALREAQNSAFYLKRANVWGKLDSLKRGSV